MTIPKVNSLGWSFGEKLTSTQLNIFDTYLSTRALDGGAGGQYTPSAQLDLRGTGGGAGSALNLQNAPTIDSQTITICQPIVPVAGVGSSGFEIPGNWYWSRSDGNIWRTITTTVSCFLAVPFTRIPQQPSTLTAVRFRVKGANYTALPTSMPEFEIEYFSAADVSTAPAPQDVVDSSADTTAFNAWHTVTVTLSTPLALGHSSNQHQIYSTVEFLAGGDTGVSRYFALGRIEADFTVTKLSAG